MTPRLRNLLIGLGISVVIMIVDQVNQSSGSSKKPQKAKTQRTKKVVAESSAQKTSTPIAASVSSATTTKRRSSRSSQLVGWQRNPFNSVALSSEADVESGSTNLSLIHI